MKNLQNTFAVILILFVCNCGLSQTHEELKLTSYGLANPKQQVTLRTFVESAVEEILVSEGQRVKKGDLLIQLDSREAFARKKIAEMASQQTGAIENAKLELEYAKENYEMKHELFAQNSLSDGELKEAKLRWDRATATHRIEIEKLASNKARFELACAELENYSIRAPFDGEVEEVSVTEGESVGASTNILKLISMNFFRVEIYLPLNSVEKYKIGDQVLFEIGGLPNKRHIFGAVKSRSGMIEATTGMLRYVFEIDNRIENLPAGFSLRISAKSDQATEFDVAAK